MSDVKICPSHDLLRFILQATTMIGAHRNIVVLLKISVFVYIFLVPAGHLSGTISCAAPIPKSWVDPSWDRPSQNRAWAPPNFGTFSCARQSRISGRSLIKITNSTGPSTLPCGTPLVTFDQSENIPFTDTLCCLQINDVSVGRLELD